MNEEKQNNDYESEFNKILSESLITKKRHNCFHLVKKLKALNIEKLDKTRAYLINNGIDNVCSVCDSKAGKWAGFGYVPDCLNTQIDKTLIK